MCCKIASIATMQQWLQVPSAAERSAAEEAREETSAHSHNDYPLRWKCQPWI